MLHSRRLFIKITSFIAALILITKKAFSKECPVQDTTTQTDMVALERQDLLYWIDGALEDDNVSLAIQFKKLQTEDLIIKKVIVMDASSRVRGVKYFETFTQNTFHPVAVFHNLAVSTTNKLFILFAVASKEAMSTFIYTITSSEIRRSDFRDLFLPLRIKDFLKAQSLKVSSMTNVDIRLVNQSLCPEGLLNPDDCFKKYWFKSQLLEIQEDRFALGIKHSLDSSSELSWQYFLITDPVGKIISLLEVPGKNPNPLVLLSQNQAQLTAAWPEIPQENMAALKDCPYIKVFGINQQFVIVDQIWLR